MWDQASRYNLEPPLVALALGLLISNTFGVPKWADAGLRVEFYVKTGIVLLGTSLPLTLIAWAGPVAIVQAAIVSLVTFGVIYLTALRLGLDRRLAAVLGTGGAVCGVSGSIAVAGAVGAKREQVSVAISLVVFWAIVMIYVLPLASRALGLSTGVAGAWIGTSEFADAAGLAAAQAYGGYAGNVPGIHGTADAAVNAFTLMKVIGRDIWIGVWALVLSLVATARWESTGVRNRARSRRDLAPLSQVRARLPAGISHRDLGRPGPQLRRLQADRGARVGRAAAGAAHLGLHFCVPEHWPDHASARVLLGGRAAVLRIYSGCRGQRGTGIHPVDAQCSPTSGRSWGNDRNRATDHAGAGRAALVPGCAYFRSHPAEIEGRLRGLNSMSSAYASVRAEDGLCRRHDRYVSASSVCADYAISRPVDVTGMETAGASALSRGQPWREQSLLARMIRSSRE